MVPSGPATSWPVHISLRLVLSMVPSGPATSWPVHISLSRGDVLLHRPQTAAVLLDQHSLALQDLQRRLEARDLRLAAALGLSVRFDLLVALLVQALQHGLHGVELLLHALAVRLGLGRLLVPVLELLGLVLDVLVLVRFLQGVLLGLLLVLGHGGLLRGDDLREVLREVALDDLEEADDAGARSLGRRVGLPFTGIV